MLLARRAGTVLGAITLLGAALGIQSAALAGSPDWKIVASPNHPQATLSFLAGVSCSAASGCVAVGYWDKTAAHTSPLLEGWNGRHWSLLRPPGIVESADLLAVSCSSAAFCMAVGYEVIGTKDQLLTVSWNGHSAHHVLFPAVSGALEGQLTSVSCSSRTDCIAVGWTNNGDEDSPLIARYNGIQWTLSQITGQVTAGDISLSSVSCSTAKWCVAVGSGGADSGGVLLTSVDQKIWAYSSKVKLPAAESGFYDVSCTGKKTCVALGWGALMLNKDFKWVVESGYGNTWREHQAPLPDKLPLAVPEGMSCSAGQCTIAGYLDYGFSATSRFTSLIMSWNGHKLSTLPSTPVPHSRDSEFGGVNCTAGTCWAVGTSGTKKVFRSLIERSWSS